MTSEYDRPDCGAVWETGPVAPGLFAVCDLLQGHTQTHEGPMYSTGQPTGSRKQWFAEREAKPSQTRVIKLKCGARPNKIILSGWYADTMNEAPMCLLEPGHEGQHEGEYWVDRRADDFPARVTWALTHEEKPAAPFQTKVTNVWINAGGELLVKHDNDHVIKLCYDYTEYSEFGTPDEWREIELP